MRGRPAEGEPGGGAPCPHRGEASSRASGRATPGDERRFEEHLERCPECRAEAADAEQVFGLLRGSPPAGRDADLLPRILARMNKAEPARRAPSLRLPAAAALVLAATGLGIGVWSGVPGAGGGKAVGPELAVRSAVGWLERSQEPSGAFSAARWGGDPSYDVGLTGLAALALLAGQGPESPGAARAIRSIIESQSEDGLFGPGLPGAVYNHGIATAAILEAFASSRDESLRGPIDRAVRLIERTRCSGGGWGYLDGAMAEANTSATCWPLQALIIARTLGWKGLDGAIDGGFRHLARVTDERGRLGYRRAGDYQAGPVALSSMGALCLLLTRDVNGLPPGIRGRILDGVTRASASRPSGPDLYRDFFLTAALEAFPVDRRGGWPGEARRALVTGQVREGPHRGSWEPSDTWGPAGGRVYSTALGALILEATGRGRRLAAWTAGRS